MSDVIDQGCEREQMDTASAVDAARHAAAKIPAGNAGTCFRAAKTARGW